MTRTLPWFNLGNPTGEATTAKDAIVNAGLDWEVEKRKTYTLNESGNKILIPDQYAVVRKTDDAVLGAVKSRYQVFQNSEAFAFADSIVESGEASFEMAGPLKGGKIVFLAMKYPESLMIGGEDRHDLYLLLRTAHNGGGAISVFLTPIRYACTNVLATATKTAVQKWSMPHVGDMAGRLEEARQTLRNTNEYIDEFKIQSEELMRTTITKDQAQDIIEAILPPRPKTEEKVDAILDWYDSSPTNGYAGTGWGLLNAITEYQEHGVEHRSPEAHFWTAVDGYVNTWRNRAVELILR